MRVARLPERPSYMLQFKFICSLECYQANNAKAWKASLFSLLKATTLARHRVVQAARGARREAERACSSASVDYRGYHTADSTGYRASP